MLNYQNKLYQQSTTITQICFKDELKTVQKQIKKTSFTLNVTNYKHNQCLQKQTYISNISLCCYSIEIQFMAEENNLDIKIAVTKDILAKPIQEQDIQLPKDDLQRRKAEALRVNYEKQLRNESSRKKILEQQKAKKKFKKFEKLCPTIEEQLIVLKLEMKNEDEYYQYEEWLYCIQWKTYSDLKQKFEAFETNLEMIRQTTCCYKYCSIFGPCQQSSQQLFFCSWLCIWPIAFLCCCRGGLKQNKSKVKLQQLYQRYDKIMQEGTSDLQ